MSELLDGLLDEDGQTPPETKAKDIAHAVIEEIKANDNFSYVLTSVGEFQGGFHFYFACRPTKPTGNQDARRRDGAIPRQGNPRTRVDCGGSVSILVTTRSVTIDYKHGPIHKKAPCRAVDERLKEIIRDNNFASARELRQYLQHALWELPSNSTTGGHALINVGT
jgi:hypothetical protein